MVTCTVWKLKAQGTLAIKPSLFMIRRRLVNAEIQMAPIFRHRHLPPLLVLGNLMLVPIPPDLAKHLKLSE
jgi:hypothetical protein